MVCGFIRGFFGKSDGVFDCIIRVVDAIEPRWTVAMFFRENIALQEESLRMVVDIVRLDDLTLNFYTKTKRKIREKRYIDDERNCITARIMTRLHLELSGV